MLARHERGDTIIEVLIAITVFSMVAVGSLLIMNQGVSLAQRSLETTLVRQQIDAQADLIRYAHAVYINDPASESEAAKVWRQVKEQSSKGSIAEFGGASECPSDITGGFVVSRASEASKNISLTSTPFLEPAQVYSQVNVNRLAGQSLSQGLWVQSVRINPTSDAPDAKAAYDLHIRACWSSPGSDVPATIGTIVRLYEPAN